MLLAYNRGVVHGVYEVALADLHDGHENLTVITKPRLSKCYGKGNCLASFLPKESEKLVLERRYLIRFLFYHEVGMLNLIAQFAIVATFIFVHMPLLTKSIS